MLDLHAFTSFAGSLHNPDDACYSYAVRCLDGIRMDEIPNITEKAMSYNEIPFLKMMRDRDEMDTECLKKIYYIRFRLALGAPSCQGIRLREILENTRDVHGLPIGYICECFARCARQDPSVLEHFYPAFSELIIAKGEQDQKFRVSEAAVGAVEDYDYVALVKNAIAIQDLPDYINVVEEQIRLMDERNLMET